MQIYPEELKAWTLGTLVAQEAILHTAGLTSE